MDGNARELLKVTYLKPLRDAENELTPGYRSRLAQILLGHKDFKKRLDAKHEFEEIIKEANDNIKKLFEDPEKYDLIDKINLYVASFLHPNDNRKAEITIAQPELARILRSLSLILEENTSGMGTLNKLFMAAELLHLASDPYNGLKLCLIEELEAHLHPQAQLRVIKALEKIENTQIILTTHSTTLGASIPLDNLILCKRNDVYPMWKGGLTKLKDGDYNFLQRFLDVTKANLLFARGVILVEGDAENLLIPTIAELIGKPLHKYGVSIVNVGSTAFLRYAKIFMRNDGKKLNIPVSVITDRDIPPLEHYMSINKNKCYILKTKDGLPDNYSYDNILNKAYPAKKDLISALRKNNRQIPKEDETKIKTSISEIDVDGFEEVIKEFLENERSGKETRTYNNLLFKDNSPVQLFMSKKWTLEYDLVLSVNFQEYLIQAILMAKKIKSNDGLDLNEIPESIIQKAKDKYKNKTREEVAYEINEVLRNDQASKAVTAQIFSNLLIKKFIEIIPKNEKRQTLIRNCYLQILKKDKYIQYIINAIITCL